MNCFLCDKPVERNEASAFLGRYAHKECFLASMAKQRDAIVEVQRLEKERIGGKDEA